MPSPSLETAPSHVRLSIQLGNEILSIEIPPRPRIIDQISAEMRKPEPDFKALAGVVSRDLGLAASVMRVSNSAAFGIGKKVRSISEALMVLGLKVTITTIAGIALKSSFPEHPALERFWDAAARLAHVSGWLIQQLPKHARIRANDAYTFGLFRDAGIAALLIPVDGYAEILARANQDDAPGFTAVEDAALATNHAIVGTTLAKAWLMHEDIVQAIRFHHDVSALAAGGGQGASPGEDARFLIAVSHVAEHLIGHAEGRAPSGEWRRLGAPCLEILALTADQLGELQTAAPDVVHGAP